MATNNIKIQSNPDMTMHELSFTVGAKGKDAIFGLYESNKNTTDFGLIDKGVEGFNAKSNKLISKYGYTVINDKSAQVEVLFKHMFKMMNETRKFVVAKVEVVSDTKISIKFSPTILPGFAIPAGAELTYAGRAASAAPAVGYLSEHNKQQQQLVDDALTIK